MKLNNYFELEEFIPPQIFKRWGTNSIQFLDPKILAIATAYREFFGVPVHINNWHKGGPLSYRGYRPPRVNVGGEYSQHKFGRAFDCNIGNMTSKEMSTKVLDNWEHFKTFGLTTLENYKFTDTWLHSDCRITNQDTPLIVDPL